MRFLIVGMFGAGNFGDEIFSNLILKNLSDRNLGPNYLYTTNDEISRKNIPVEYYAFPSVKISFDRLKNIIKLRDIDYMLIGGGGLFNEVFSYNSILSSATITLLCLFFGKRYAIHGIEIGYINSNFLKFLTKFVFRNADYVMVRDKKTYKKTQDWGINNVYDGIDLSHDFFYKYFSDNKRASEGKNLVVNVQHALTLCPFALEKILGLFANKDYNILFLVTSASEVKSVKEFIATSSLSGYSNISIDYNYSIQSNLAYISQSDILITEKFHFTIAGFHSNKTTYILPLTSKVISFVSFLKESLSTGVTIIDQDLVELKGNNSERDNLSGILATQNKIYFNTLIKNISKKKVPFIKKVISLFLLVSVIIMGFINKFLILNKYKIDRSKL